MPNQHPRLRSHYDLCAPAPRSPQTEWSEKAQERRSADGAQRYGQRKEREGRGVSGAPALHQYPHHATRRRRREQARSKRKETKLRSEHGPRGPVDEGEEARRGNSSALESCNLTCDVTGDVMNTPRSYVDFTLHMTRTLRTTRKRAMGRCFFPDDEETSSERGGG